ncbi:MAG: 1,4-beta-xylanase [Porphyromonadaceae bacterium CG2_30_38_12]|nr:MAG: 1,4-beta-xylanase [Porphyromonadaceae bacterium CG2_30_38_12]
MKKNSRLKTILVFVVLLMFDFTIKSQVLTLKEAYKDIFLIGVAMSSDQIVGKNQNDLRIIKNQFNSIVAENSMKNEFIQPTEGKFDFELADRFVKFGEQHEMKIIGHTLIWHSQVAPWFFVDKNGNEVSRMVLIKRMKDYITTVVTRYKGKIKGWDVVNEALTEDGSLRNSTWYKIIGPEFIQLAFEFAHAADPNAELYYNDYNLYKPSKRAGAIELVKSLKQRGCRIDAVGEQGHYSLAWNNFSDLEETIVSFSDIGLKVMITELDISVLPSPNEKMTAEINQSYQYKTEYNLYSKYLPDSVQLKLTCQYERLFEILNKHRRSIGRVTFWGLNDAQTWRNNWPIAGRTDYPLLFDRKNKQKPALVAIINQAKTDRE